MGAPFTAEDFRDLGELTLATWAAGVDRDWSVPAGTLEWSCWRTAAHTVDSVLAPAMFLASRRRHAYPVLDDLTVPAAATPADLVDDMRAVVNTVWGVLATTPPDAEAIIRRRPAPEVAPATDFPARCALEMILHTSDIAAGLGLPLDPPAGHCRRLLDQTARWPSDPIEPTDDPWSDLLASWGRPRP